MPIDKHYSLKETIVRSIAGGAIQVAFNMILLELEQSIKP